MHDTPVLRELTILGKTILAKGYLCSDDGVTYQEKPANLRLQLSICPTSLCPAACPFCIAAADRNNSAWIDLKKLEQVLTGLHREQVIRGISITGGEPFLDMTLLDETIHLIFEILGYHTEVSLNTNGMYLSQMHKIRDLSYIDALHVSRHHYRDDSNDRLFAMKMPSAAELKEIISSISYPDLFVLNCILLKDYIGTREEVHQYLDFAIEIGVPKVSFITPAPVNAYVQSQIVNYSDLLSPSDKTMMFTRCFQDYEFCRCQDGIYVSEQGKLVRFYGRSTDTRGLTYCRGLVYGPDNLLRAGFGGEVIWGTSKSIKYGFVQ